MDSTLKIGLTASPLTLMPHPSGRGGVPRSYEIIRDDLQTVLNERLATYTGIEKEELTLQFENKRKADFDTLKAYCNVPTEYYVEIAESDGTKHFDGFAYLTMNSVDIDSRVEPFTFNFSITIHEL
jgi:hypothetical protein